VGGKGITWLRRGGRPSTLVLRGPRQYLGGDVGISVGQLSGIGAGFTGVLWRRDDRGNETDVWTELTFADPTIYFPKRIVKDGEDIDDPVTGEPDPGNFSTPSIIEDYLYWPAIMAAAVNNSNALDGSFGPTGLSVGGAVLDLAIDLTGFRPASWPITLDGLRAMLANGGVCDYIVSGTSVVFYEGNAGGASGATFEYDTGSENCVGFRRSIDMDNVFNVVWTFLGPKEPLYDNDVQHWKGNVTIDDSPLGPNAGVEDNIDDPLYGQYVGIPDPPFTEISAQVFASRSAYGRMQVINEYDAYKDEATTYEKRAKRRLYQMLWLRQSLYCANPRQLVTMIPQPGITPSFDVYDTVTVAVGASGGSFSGEQRIYEFTCDIDTEGVAQLSQLVTSPNLG
jgi:hypothetical protein